MRPLANLTINSLSLSQQPSEISIVVWATVQTNPKKKRRPAEANRHLPVNSRPLIELLTIGGHDRQP
jgi:hypothetical protein